MPSHLAAIALRRARAIAGPLLGFVGGVATTFNVHAASGRVGEAGFCGFFGRVWAFGGRLGGMAEASDGPRCGGIALWDIAFLGVLAVVLVAAIRFRHLTVQRRLDLARRMVERGLEPPDELWGAQAAGDLRRGVVLLCAGIGVLVASHVGGREGLAAAGLIPGFIGIGYLLSHRFASSRRAP